MNQVEGKVGKSLEVIDTGKDLLNRIPVVQALRSAINKLDFMKLKSFCVTKNTITGKTTASRMGKDCYQLNNSGKI